MRRPVTSIITALVLALCAGLGLVFLNAYRHGITIRLGENGRPALPPPPPTASALPDEQSQPYTNEQLHAMLQEETSKLGIQRLVPRGERADAEEPAESFLGPSLGAPGARAQAEAAIRQIQSLRRSVDAAAGKPKPVPLEGEIVPVLAAPDSGGVALDPAAAMEPGVHPAPQAATSSPGSWSGLYGGAAAGTLTISDAQAWAKLWRGLSRKPVPDLDFSRRQIEGVFLGPQPTGGFSVEIFPAVSVLPTAVVVRYRVRSPAAGRTPPEGATSPYALRAIERTSLPVRFENER